MTREEAPVTVEELKAGEFTGGSDWDNLRRLVDRCRNAYLILGMVRWNGTVTPVRSLRRMCPDMGADQFDEAVLAIVAGGEAVAHYANDPTVDHGAAHTTVLTPDGRRITHLSKA